jgi:hypothetical protein
MNGQPTSLAFMRRGTERIPIVARQQCKTCCSARRRKIENLLVEGVSPRLIMERLPPDHHTSEQSIKRHFHRGHIPIDHREVVRRMDLLAEKRWQEVGEAATEARIVSGDAAATVVAAGFGRFEMGDLEFNVKDVLRAGRLLHDIERENRRLEQAERIGVQRLDSLVIEMVRLLDLVGEVGGLSVRNDVFRRACRDDVTKVSFIDERFSAIRGVVDYEDHARLVAEYQDREQQKRRRRTGQDARARSVPAS